MEWEGGREGGRGCHRSDPVPQIKAFAVGLFALERHRYVLLPPFLPRGSPEVDTKGHTSIRKSCRGERGGGTVSRPDTSLIGCLDWSRHKRIPLSIPLPLPLSPLRPFSFHRPSPRHHQAAPSCRCCSTSLFTFSRSPHNQSRPRPTFRPRKFVPKNIWRLILTLSLSLNLYPRCPLL